MDRFGLDWASEGEVASLERGEQPFPDGVPPAAVANGQGTGTVEGPTAVGTELIEAEPSPGATGSDEIGHGVGMS